MSKHALCEVVVASVRGTIPIQVLRGLDESATAGGDVDLIVPPGAAHSACLLAARTALDHGWYLVGFRSLGYVVNATFLHPTDEADEVVKLDFVDGLAWRGIALDPRRANPFSPSWERLHDGWEDRRVLGGLTFFQKIMAAGAVSAKEWDRIAATGATAEYLAELAAKLDLPITQTEIESLRISRTRKWRLRAASCGVSGPFSFVRWAWRVAVAAFCHSLGLGLGSGLVLGVSGPDGSGKSTLVDRFVAACAKCGRPPQMVHLLPKWIPMPHQVLRRHRTTTNYTKPYSEPPVKSRANGVLRLAYYLWAFALTRAWLAIVTAQGKLVVMDRSVVDFASDPTRARIPAGLMPRALLPYMAPRGQLFYLNVSPAVAIARKGELTLERAGSLQASYLEISRALHVVVLDADAPADAVFRNFLSALSDEYTRRIRARGGSGAL